MELLLGGFGTPKSPRERRQNENAERGLSALELTGVSRRLGERVSAPREQPSSN